MINFMTWFTQLLLGGKTTGFCYNKRIILSPIGGRPAERNQYESVRHIYSIFYYYYCVISALSSITQAYTMIVCHNHFIQLILYLPSSA